MFEKVNTGGKKLDASELLTAIFASRNHELRKDWYGDKKAGLPGIKGRLDTYDVLKGLQSTDFLQAVTLLHSLDLRREDQNSGSTDDARPVVCTRDALLRLTLEGYLQHRDPVERSFRTAALRTRLSAAYKGFNAILMKRGAKDFRSGQSFDDSVFSSDQLDIHHVFPKAWCQRNGKSAVDYDSIVNKTPIGLKTNRSIGGAAPSTYLARLRDQGSTTDASLDEHLRTHAISPEYLRGDDFEKFMAARRDALLDLVAGVIGEERVERGHRPSALDGQEDAASLDDEAVVADDVSAVAA